MPKRITSVEDLKKLLERNSEVGCFIHLGNCLASSKTLIPQEDGAVVVIHEIDDSISTINSIEKIMTSKKTSNIAEAIQKGAFYAHDYNQGLESINETCKYCGCTENKACLGGCYWIKPSVCSKCADKEK